MARTRTVRRTRKTKKTLPFFPESFQAFLARRFVDIIAAVFCVSGLFLFAALVSYNHADPSSNTAPSSAGDAAASISNWAGASGAWVSDSLIQTLGAGSFALVLGLLSWALRTYRRESLRPFWLRIIALMVSSVFLSVALAQVPSQGWTLHPYLGSSAGTLSFEQFYSLAHNISPVFGPLAIALIAGVFALSSFLFAAGVTRAEIMTSLLTVKSFVTGIVVISYAAFQGFQRWVMHYNDPSYRPQPVKFLKIYASSYFKIQRIMPRINTGKLGAGSAASASSEISPIAAPISMAAPNAAPAPHSAQTTAPNVPQSMSPSPHIPVVAPQKGTPAQEGAQTRFMLSEGEWELPSITLLEDTPSDYHPEDLNEEALRKNAELLKNVLADFNVQGDIVSIHPGPVVTLYELEPAPGTKTSRVISLSDDIARSMSAISVRCAVISGRNVIGIELPNKQRQTVYMQDLLASRLFEKTAAKLPLILGKDISGQPILADLAKMPHLLVAGTTGSGKSVAVNTMILSILFRLPPEKCRFIMIDPKMLELSVYDDIPHLLSPVVTDPGKAVVALKWAVQEMEERYRAMSKLGVRNVEGYNNRLAEARKKGETIMHKTQTGFDPETGKPTYEEQAMDLTELPYIVIIVDEFADLMLVAGKDVENAIQRLAQMARAAGIHLIMATQRPSVDVITGVIKANFPTRISFQVTSKIDSRTILGEGGAEQLLGMGDMLYMAPGGRVTRVHGPFVSDGDVEKVVKYLKSQGEPAYLTDVTEGGDFGDSDVMAALFSDRDSDDGAPKIDELYDKAVAIVAREGKASTSFVQRHLQIGYNRAARIIEEMERQGIISAANSTGKREILVRDFSDV